MARWTSADNWQTRLAGLGLGSLDKSSHDDWLNGGPGHDALFKGLH